MSDLQKAELGRVITDLDSIFESMDDRRLFLQTVKHGDETVLGGNTEGLVFLALHLLTLATEGLVGSHVHLDADSPLDRCDEPLVLRRDRAPWSDEAG